MLQPGYYCDSKGHIKPKKYCTWTSSFTQKETFGGLFGLQIRLSWKLRMIVDDPEVVYFKLHLDIGANQIQ